jgi:PAS domain-containing protein
MSMQSRKQLTGWSRQAAVGRPLAEVFRVVNADSREVAQDPLGLAIRENKAVSLTPNCVLERRDGSETYTKIPLRPFTTGEAV